MKRASWCAVWLCMVIGAGACSPQTGHDYVPRPDEIPQASYLIDSLAPPAAKQLHPRLELLVKLIEAGSFGNIHSLIIIQNDQVVMEKYFRGWTRHMLHPIYSASKSVVSALIGIAIDQGIIENVDAEVMPFFPEYTDLENDDARRDRITLRHLLNYTAGFAWDEMSTHYFDSAGNYNPENIAVRCFLSDDPLECFLDQPVQAEPGTEFTYNSGCSNLIAALLTRTAGQTPPQFAEAYLFEPLGITQWQWKTQECGIIDNATSVFIHPSDFAMFAYLFLKNGELQGQQIIPENWVRESTAIQAETTLDGRDMAYGYQWWRMPESDYAPIEGMYYAAGVYGQLAFVLPNLNAVVVMTGGTYEAYMQNAFGMLMGCIVPALSGIAS